MSLLRLLKVGLIGFGGGSALIPVIEREMVDEGRAVSKEEYDIDVLAASITPGALPVEIAGGIGYSVMGPWGMLLGSCAMALPGVLLTLLCLTLLHQVDDVVLRQVGYVSIGVSAFVCCLLTDYVLRTLLTARRERLLWPMAAMVVAVGACRVMRWLSTLQVFGVAFGIIFLTYLVVYGHRRRRRTAAPGAGRITFWSQLHGFFRVLATCVLFVTICLMLAWMLVPGSGRFALKGLLSSVMSFGGGDAYLSVADGLFVQDGFLSERDYFGTLVPVVNVLPGSILCKTLSGIGYYLGLGASGRVVGGCLAALLGFAVSVSASCAVFMLVRCLYKAFGALTVFQVLRRWIRPVVSGLLIGVAMSLFRSAARVGSALTSPAVMPLLFTLLYALCLWLYYRWHWSTGRLAALVVVLSLLVCNIC